MKADKLISKLRDAKLKALWKFDGDADDPTVIDQIKSLIADLTTYDTLYESVAAYMNRAHDSDGKSSTDP